MTKEQILEILDQNAEDYSFPMLDNGYYYLASCNLTVYAKDDRWAIVIDLFGFSPRAGEPDLIVDTFSNALKNRKTESDFVDKKAYEKYLTENPCNCELFHYPIAGNEWIDFEEGESVKKEGVCTFRDKKISLPPIDEYKKHGIELEEERPQVFEFCRYLSEAHRELVDATEKEKRESIDDDLEKVLELKEWFHPDLVNDELPSQNETFIKIAEALEANNWDTFKLIKTPNSHWSNWPEGGTL